MNDPGETTFHPEDRILALLVFLIPPVAVFSSKAMAPIFLVALAVLAVSAWRRRRRPVISPPLVLGLAALAAWGALSALWAVDPGRGLRLAVSLAGMFAAGILVLGWIGDLGVRCRRAVETALLAGAATAACLYAFEAISANWLTRTGRGLGWEEIINSLTGGINVDAFLVNGVVVLTLAIWPVMAILGRRGAGGWAAVAPLVLLAIIARHGSTASLLALVGGLGVAGLARLNARWTAGVLAGLFALTVLSAPLWPRLFLAPKALPDLAVGAHRAGVPNSAVGRLLTWRFTGEKILERPFLGWGLDSSRALPGGNAKYHIRFDSLIPGRGEIVFHDSFLPLHPHSQPLQIWLELGAFGAAIVALLGGWVLWRLGDGGTREPPAVWAPGLAVAILVFAGLSFGAWQSWWIASQFLAAALMWMAGERGSPSPSAAGAKNISR